MRPTTARRSRAALPRNRELKPRRGFRAVAAVCAVVAIGASCGSDTDDDTAPARRSPTTRAGFVEPQLVRGGVQAVFESGDVFLTGQLFGSKRGSAVLLVHDPATDMRSLFPLAERLAALGLVAFGFDFRGYGQSQGDKDPATYASDVAAALQFLGDRGNGPLAVIGVAAGGTASVIAAADAQPVKAVALINTGPTSGSLDATEAARRLRAKSVVFASGDDEGERLAGLIPGAELRRAARRDPATDTNFQRELASFVKEGLATSE